MNAEMSKRKLNETCRGKSLDEIAAKYGVRVKTLPFALWQVELRGRYICTYGEQQSHVIHLAEDLTRKEREKVLAHELGHFFLRHSQLRYKRIVDRDGDVAYRLCHDKPEWEAEADEFAKFLISLSKTIRIRRDRIIVDGRTNCRRRSSISRKAARGTPKRP